MALRQSRDAVHISDDGSATSQAIGDVGCANLTPYLLLGYPTDENPGRIRVDDDGPISFPTKEDKTFRKNRGPDESLGVYNPETAGGVNWPPPQHAAQIPVGKHFLKRASIFVQPLKLHNYATKGREGVLQNAPSYPGATAMEFPSSSLSYCWEARQADNAQSVYSDGTLLLDLDTVDLYENCGGDMSSLGSLAHLGNTFDPAIFPTPGRGIPVKFQKIYFYATESSFTGQAILGGGSGTAIPGSPGWRETGDWSIGSNIGNPSQVAAQNNMWNAPENFGTSVGTLGRSDGRGSLFSAHVLMANPTNLGKEYVYEDDASTAEDAKALNWLKLLNADDDGETPDLPAWNHAGGWWDYSGNTMTTTQAQYHEGVGMHAGANGWGGNLGGGNSNPPLVMGDGALGFVERRLSSMLNAYENIYFSFVKEYEKFTKTPVTLCVSGTGESGESKQYSISGSVLFTPDPPNSGLFKELVGSGSGEIKIITKFINPQLGATGQDLLNISGCQSSPFPPSRDCIYQNMGVTFDGMSGLSGFLDNSRLLVKPPTGTT